MIEQSNLLSTVTCTQYAIQGGIMTKLSLLKSGKLISRRMIERWNPLFALNEEQGHSNSSLETTKQNHNCQWDPDHSWIGWMIKCEKDKRSSTIVTEDGEKHSVKWGLFVSSTLQASVPMGKNYSDDWHSIKNTADLTMKQMFDTSAKLVSEQDEISRLETIGWENHSWKYLSLIGEERIINLQRTIVYVFSDSVLCLGKILETTQSNDAWEQRLGCLESSQNYRNFDRIDGEPMEFEWNISQGSIRCSSVKKSRVKSYCWD